MNLVKSDRNKMLAGVCGGLGEHLRIDPALLRIGFVAAFFLGFGSPLLLYGILALVMRNPDYY